jgi:hypothetical protein
MPRLAGVASLFLLSVGFLLSACFDVGTQEKAFAEATQQIVDAYVRDMNGLNLLLQQRALGDAEWLSKVEMKVAALKATGQRVRHLSVPACASTAYRGFVDGGRTLELGLDTLMDGIRQQSLRRMADADANLQDGPRIMNAATDAFGKSSCTVKKKKLLP